MFWIFNLYVHNYVNRNVHMLVKWCGLKCLINSPPVTYYNLESIWTLNTSPSSKCTFLIVIIIAYCHKIKNKKNISQSIWVSTFWVYKIKTKKAWNYCDLHLINAGRSYVLTFWIQYRKNELFHNILHFSVAQVLHIISAVKCGINTQNPYHRQLFKSPFYFKNICFYHTQ